MPSRWRMPPEKVRMRRRSLAASPTRSREGERAVARVAPAEALEGGHVLHEVERRELRVVAEVLRQVAEKRAVGVTHALDGRAVVAHLAGGGAQPRRPSS